MEGSKGKGYKDELEWMFRSEKDGYKKTREIIADGAKLPFWTELKIILEDLKKSASEKILEVPPGAIGTIAELQQVYKVSDQIIAVVEGIASEQDYLDEKLKAKFVKEVGNDPAESDR